MAKSIDSKVVQLAFENDRFEKGVSQSLKSLNDLNKNVDKMSGSSFDQVVKAIDNMSNRFNLMGQVGFAAVNRITNAVIDLGEKLIKNLIIPPSAIAGFQEYELTINSIQTLMAGTGESLERVNEKLAELNKYSDETIYSFSDMTNNIGKFTNAGVKLNDAVDAMKGIANAAALSGASAADASRAMYNLGQAMGSGYVLRRDWMSVENANMATIEFKTQLVETAQALGLLTKRTDGYFQTAGGTHSLMALFTEGLQDQWLTTDVLIKTFNRYADATTEIGRRASQAATRVSTFSKMMDTLKEGVQSGWAQSMQLIIGDFEEATQLWSTLAGVIGTVTDATAKNRNELLKMWKDTGGRDAFIEGLSNALIALHNVVAPIKEAWRSIFPPKSGSMVVDLLKGFSRLTNGLIINQEAAVKVANVFRSVFGVLKAGTTIVKGVFSVFSSVTARVLPVIIDGFNLLSEIIEYFYKLISPYVVQGFSIAMGQLGIAMDYVAKKANGLIEWIRKTFEAFKVAAAESGAMNALSDVITNLFDSMKNLPKILNQGLNTALDSIEGVGDRFGFLGSAISFGLKLLKDAINLFGSSLENVKDGLSSTIDYLNPFKQDLDKVNKSLLLPNVSKSGIFEGLLEGLSNLNPFKATVAYADELSSGMVSIDSNLSKIYAAATSIGSKLIIIAGKLKDAFIGFLQTLSEMSGVEIFFTAIQAAVIVGFAKLSWTITKAITGAFVSIIGGIGKVIKSVSGIVEGVDDVVSNLSKAIGRFGKDKASTVIQAISVSLLAFAASLFIISKIPFDKLIQGSAAIGIFMLGLIGMMVVFNKFEGSESMAAQIAGVSASLIILSFAIHSLGSMDMITLGKGLGVVALGLTAMFIPLKLLGSLFQNGSISGLGSTILAMSISLKLLIGTIKSFSEIDMDSLVKGILGVASSLTALILPLRLLTNIDTGKLIGMGGVLFGVAASIRLLVSSIKSLSKVESLVKTFITFVGIIGTLSAVLAGLAVLNSKYDLESVGKAISKVATSLGILSLAMIPLTLISWTTMSKGIVLLAGAFASLLAAGAIFSVFPKFSKGAEAFATVLHILGKAIMAVSAGIAIFAAGLLLLGTAGTAGLIGLSTFLIMLSSVSSLIQPIIGIIAALGASLVFLGLGVLALGTGFSLLDKGGVAGILVLTTLFGLLVAFSDNVKKIEPNILSLSLSVAVLSLAFFALNKVINKLEFIATVKLAIIGGALILFTELLGQNIESAAMAASSITILAGALYLLSSALSAASLSGGLIIVGIAAIILSIAAAMIAIEGLVQTLENIDGKKVGHNFVDIGVGMVEGLIDGIASIGQKVIDAMSNLITRCINTVKSILDINSPSKVFYEFGQNTGQGYANGLSDSSEEVKNGAINMITPGIEETKKASLLYEQEGIVSVNNYKEGLSNSQAVQSVKDAASKLGTEASNALGSVSGVFYGTGQKVVESFSQGAQNGSVSSLSNLTPTLQSAIDNAIGKKTFVTPESFKGVDFETVYNQLETSSEETTEKTDDAWTKVSKTIKDKTGISIDAITNLKDSFKNIDADKLLSGDKTIIDEFGESIKNLAGDGTTGLGWKGALDKLRETFGLDKMMDLGLESGKGLNSGMNNALGSPDAKDKIKKSGKDQAKSFMDGFSEGVKDLDKVWTPFTVQGYNENETLSGWRKFYQDQALVHTEGIEDLKSLNQELADIQDQQANLQFNSIAKEDRDQYNKQRDALDQQERILRQRISVAQEESRLATEYAKRAAEKEKQLSYQRAYDEKYAEYLAKGQLEYNSYGDGKLPKEVMTQLKANFLQDENAIREMKRQQWQREMEEEKKLAEEATKTRADIALEQSKTTDQNVSNIGKIPGQLSTTTQNIANQTGAMAQTATTAINTTLDGLVTGTSAKTNQLKTAIAQPVQEFAMQITAQTPMLQESANQMMNTLATTISAQAPTFDQLGYTIMQAFITGLTQRDPAMLSTAITQMFELVKTNFQPVVEQFIQLGVDIATGLASGIESGSSRAIQAAISLATRALQAAKSALNSNSPSKEFSTLGNDCALGLAQGLSNSQAVQDVQNGSKSLAEITMNSFSNNLKNADISGLSSALTEASNMVQNSMTSEPVIRPVVDLTDVEAASKQTGAMFNNQQLNVSGSSSSAQMASAQYNLNNTLRAADVEVQREAIVNQKSPLTVNLTNNVRNDSDIQKISKELNILIRNQGYAMGNII